MTTASPVQPGLLAVTVAALQDSGRMVATDWDAETFDVLPRQQDRSPTLGVVFAHSRSVVFYAVRDEAVPDRHRAAVAQLVLQANTELNTCAFEFAADSGILSVRSGLRLGAVHIAYLDQSAAGGHGGLPVLARDAFTALLVSALDQVESVAAEYAPRVDQLLTAPGGRSR